MVFGLLVDMILCQLFWDWKVAGQYWGVWLACRPLDSSWQQGWLGGQEGGGLCHLSHGDHDGAGGEGEGGGFGSWALHGFPWDKRPHWSQRCTGIFTSSSLQISATTSLSWLDLTFHDCAHCTGLPLPGWDNPWEQIRWGRWPEKPWPASISIGW